MNVEVAKSVSARLRGLLWRREFTGALLIAPCHDVHTFGMRRAIDVAFVDADGIVIGVHRQVGSRCRIRCKGAAAAIERFARPSSWYEIGDQVDLGKYGCENRR